MLRKLKGFLMVEAVLACVVFSLLGLSLTQIFGGSLSSLAASKNALRGQQYAEIDANILKRTSYEDLSSAAHAKQAIENGNGWASAITLGTEKEKNGVKYRTATVNVYKTMASLTPSFSMNVPLSSYGSLSELRNSISGLSSDMASLRKKVEDIHKEESTSAHDVDRTGTIKFDQGIFGHGGWVDGSDSYYSGATLAETVRVSLAYYGITASTHKNVKVTVLSSNVWSQYPPGEGLTWWVDEGRGFICFTMNRIHYTMFENGGEVTFRVTADKRYSAPT